jgi:magnesium-transporting ATPase (P-type)
LISNKNPFEIITSAELASMSDAEIKKRLPSFRVVARALPEDKSRLVRLSQEMGLVTGMTGDGINDAPALKKADVGFSMGSGTEVAKEAGDIVILDDNIASIAKAILYGRTIFKSIRKFIIFQLTMNLCAVGVSIIGPFIGIDTPVTVIQMLWINIIMDTLAGLAFAGEPPLAEYMTEPPKSRGEPVLNKYMLHQILCMGLFTVLLCVLFLKLPVIHLLFRYAGDPIYFMTAFFALFIFAGVFNSFNARTHRIYLLTNLRRNPMFLLIMTMVAVIQILLIYYGGSLFRTAGLTLEELRRVLLIALLVVPADCIRKLVLRLFGKQGTL